MIIGGISGALSRTLTAPLELNKIQKQNSFMKNNNLSYVIKNEGITKLWKGNMANVIRIFPDSIQKFHDSEFLKSALSR